MKPTEQDALKAREASKKPGWVRPKGCTCNYQTLEAGCRLHDWTDVYEEKD